LNPESSAVFFGFIRGFIYLCGMKKKELIDGAEIIGLEAEKVVSLPLYEGGSAGFESPAADYAHESLDMNERFVHHPEASYFLRIKGDSMIGAGIMDGDICLVDRMEEPHDGAIVAAWHNGGQVVKYLDTSTREQGFLRLVPANPAYPPIIVDANDQLIIQGVVTSVHRDTTKHRCTP
jgi:DNA polymerase V